MSAELVFVRQWPVSCENRELADEREGLVGSCMSYCMLNEGLRFNQHGFGSCWNMDLSSNANPGSVGLSRSVLKNVLC